MRGKLMGKVDQLQNGFCNGLNNDTHRSNGAIFSIPDDLDVEMPECHRNEEMPEYSANNEEEMPEFIGNEEEMPECVAHDEEEMEESHSNEETFQAISLYIDYDFEPVKRIKEINVEEEYHEDDDEQLYLGFSDGSGKPSSDVILTRCTFIGDEPGISTEPEELTPTQKVLKNVLIPCLHEYLQDYTNLDEKDSDEERKTVDAENRADLLGKLNYELLIDRKSWRLREKFAEECLKLCKRRKISVEQVNDIICSFALTFMDDGINGVRVAGAELLAEIFSMFIEKEWPDMMIEDEVEQQEGSEDVESTPIVDSMPFTKALLIDGRKSFLRSNSWRRRQTWAIVLEYLSQRISLLWFCNIFESDLLQVGRDKVRNTRMKFCSILQSLFDCEDHESPMKELFPTTFSLYQNMITNMAQSDPDFEVQNRAQMLLGIIDPVTDYLDYIGFVKKRKMENANEN